MEKVKNNGAMRLPPGFRFHPTDEELVVEYLKRKVLCCRLPASIIPEVDVCKADPWDLPETEKWGRGRGLYGGGAGEKGEEERYLFSRREAKYPNGNGNGSSSSSSRSNRATVSGYWKATGKDKPILQHLQVVGMKKTLAFYKGKPPSPKGSRTDWIMHEYRLVNHNRQLLLSQSSSTEDYWVLCRIFLKKRNAKQRRQSNNQDQDQDQDINIPIDHTNTNPTPVLLYYDFMCSDTDRSNTRSTTDLNLSPSSSSSASSGVTQVSSPDETFSS